MRKLSLIFLVLLLSAACRSSDLADNLEGSWHLVSGTVDGEEIPMIEDHPITITFEGGRVGGVASCNSYGGTFELTGSHIGFSDLAMTEMACLPRDAMRAESMYAGALRRVDTVSLEQGLTMRGNEVELIFEAEPPVPDAELTNTVWVLDGLIDGDTVSTPAMDVRATVEFFTDSSMIGDTGCRHFTGHYEISGREVSVSDLLAVDQEECQSGLIGQDQQVISVLGDGFRVDIEGARLVISSRDDKGLMFIAEE